MKVRLRVFGFILGCTLAAASASRADATIIFTAQEVGNDVTLTSTGTVILTSINTNAFADVTANMNSVDGSFAVGVSAGPGPGLGLLVFDNAIVSGPTSFGTGNLQVASSASGPAFFLSPQLSSSVGIDFFQANQGVPDTIMAGSAIWNNTTLLDLGLTPGTYVWELSPNFFENNGPGQANDTIVLNIIAPAAVPEPGSAFLLALGAMGLAFLRWRRKA